MTARRIAVAFLLLLCGFASGLVLLGRMHALDDASAQSPVQPRGQAPAVAVAAPAAAAAATSVIPDFSRIAEQAVPAVVNVSSVQYTRRRLSPYANDPFFQIPDLFGDSRELGPRRPFENSLGSGVLVSRDGYILTNNHVVTGDSGGRSGDIEITVALADKRELRAKVIGVDRGTDLALLKIEGNNFPTLPWGDSKKLKVAEWVLAIGNPYQLSETVTLGIVSAVNRTNVGINLYEDFIQTDAAINPGNSGGALVNARGELIGINTAIFSQSGGYQGIGFAVASHLAQETLKDLQQYGQVPRGTIGGIAVTTLNPSLAARYSLPNTPGVLIYRTSRQIRTGFEPGDIIVSFNGTEVNEDVQLIRLMGDAKIGSTATVVVIRDGRRMELKVPIEQQRR